MKYDTLLFSRTLRDDYQWMYRPQYVDDSINTLLRPLFLMIESPKNREFFIEKGMRNFYFFVEKEYSVLCYLYFTNQTDMVGRQIYALEGICCSKKDCLLMWNMLPEIILSVYQMGIGFHLYISKQEELLSLYPRTLDIVEEKKYIWEEGKYDVSILNLVDGVQCAQSMYSFVFGTEDEGFYKGITSKKYKVCGKREPKIPPPPSFVEFIKEDICNTKFYFAKESDEYTLSIIAFDPLENMISGYTDAVSFDKNGISMAVLNFILDKVKSDMAKYGYRLEQKEYDETEVQRSLKLDKQPFDFAEGNFSISLIECVLKVSDGYIEDFKSETHKIIRQLFLYSRRIRGIYYGANKGLETIYILNMKDGLWMFYIEREEKVYRLKGIWIDDKERNKAWIYREQLIKTYLWNGEVKYSDEFEKVYERFVDENRTYLQPRSSIITLFPAGDFPQLSNIDIYSALGNTKSFVSIDNKEEIKLPEEDELAEMYSDLQAYVLTPPMLGFGKWYLLSKREKRNHKNKIRITSIVNGSCKTDILFEELGEAREKFINNR